MRENRSAYQRLWFRPRILRDVTTVDYATKLLGTPSSLPVYITATALGKLGHADGELNLTRAAAKHNIIQMVCGLVGALDGINSILHARFQHWHPVLLTKLSKLQPRIKFNGCNSM